MPTFRTTPSGNLTSAIRRMVASGAGYGPLGEIEADLAAARTARETSLAEKARAEVDAMRNAEAARSDPTLATEYAAHSAGIDMPDATRLSKAIRGVRERPSQSGGVDVDEEGNAMPDVTFARPDNLKPGAERVFRSALASTIANRLATGKTNATQLAQAGDRINETALTNEAANTADVPAANRIIAAVAGKIREPFKISREGVVLNEETGTVNEGTRLAGATRGVLDARRGELGARAGLHRARADTEGFRQEELFSRAGLNDARTGAVERGEANRGGARVTPQQVERWASDVARKEWDALSPKARKETTYDAHLNKVRERFKAPGATNPQDVITEAHGAIAKGADEAKVAKRFKEKMGFDMPKYVKPAPAQAAATEDEEED